MNNEMRHFLKTFFIFIPVAAVVYIVFLCLFGDFAPEILKTKFNFRLGGDGHMFTRLNEAEKSDVDILIIGSSHAYRSFDTEQLRNAGYNTFVIGSNSQTPLQTRAILNRYLDNLSPKTVIYEVYPAIFNLDGVESSLDFIANDKNDIESVKMALKLKHIKTFNALIYSTYLDATGRKESFKEGTVKNLDTYVPGGFVRRKLEYGEYRQYPKAKWEFDEEQLEEFDAIIKTLKEKNLNVVFVYAPVPNSVYNSYTNNDEFEKIIEKYGEEYYDFNKLVKVNDSLHFYDADHLNQKGVDIFMDKLLSMEEVLDDE